MVFHLKVIPVRVIKITNGVRHTMCASANTYLGNPVLINILLHLHMKKAAQMFAVSNG